MYRDSFDGSRYNPLEIVRTKTVFNLPLKLKEPSLIFHFIIDGLLSSGN
jgi:hypothetical protein